MSFRTGNFGKVLVLAAHPDDENIACAGLLQRATSSLVVFAVDGAPPHYGFEKQYGSLREFSDLRFREAARALAALPHCCSWRRLTRGDGSLFVDQHLFLELSEAFACLKAIAQEFSPDLIVSHAFEGGHLDHDACHFLAKRVAHTLAVATLEFPLYWKPEDGSDVFQRFRDDRGDEFVLELSADELGVKRKMLAEYRSQGNITAVFQPELERFRPIREQEITKATWSVYPFENRWRPWKAKPFFRAIDEFENRLAKAATE
jgi:N-acetylglucosamine malate deacetylase 2